jgi:predicted Zn-dependent peptidase
LIKNLRTTISSLQSSPLSPGEIQRARLEVARTFAGRFETTSQMSDAMISAVTVYQDPHYWDEYRKAISAVSVESVQAAARQLAAGSESVVVVGDAAALVTQLETAGLAAQIAK